MTVLILGGTAEARRLAEVLTAAGYDVLTSLAGRVSAPALPVGRVRIGGFGGVDGLTEFLSQHQIDAVVDATHPFAAQISANAEQAAARSGRPLLRLDRPGWADHPRAEHLDLGGGRRRGPAGRGCGGSTLPHHRTPVAGGLPALGRPVACWSGWSTHPTSRCPRPGR